jgi:hypothetical protein
VRLHILRDLSGAMVFFVCVAATHFDACATEACISGRGLSRDWLAIKLVHLVLVLQNEIGGGQRLETGQFDLEVGAAIAVDVT